MTDIAVSFVSSMVAKGVTLRVRGTRLIWSPKASYGHMTDEERATLRANKAAIIACVRERYAGVAGPIAQVAPTAAPEGVPTIAPEHCRWCNSAPCIGEAHEAFLALHPHEAQKHAEELATQEMHVSLRRGLGPWWNL